MATSDEEEEGSPYYHCHNYYHSCYLLLPLMNAVAMPVPGRYS